MPPKDEIFSKDEALRKLVIEYKVPRPEADSAVRKAESGGDGELPGRGLIVRREFSAPGPPQFTIRESGR